MGRKKKSDIAAAEDAAGGGGVNVKRGPKPLPVEEIKARKGRKEEIVKVIAEKVLKNPIQLPEVSPEQVEEARRDIEENKSKDPRIALPWLGNLAGDSDELDEIRERNRQVFKRGSHVQQSNELPTTKRGRKPSIFSDAEKVNFCTLARIGIGRNAACANLGISALRMHRTLQMDPVFGAQLKMIEKARREDCETLLYQTAMTAGHEFQFMAAIKYIGAQERRESSGRTYRLNIMDMEIRSQLAKEKLGGDEVGERPDFNRLTLEERDEFDYLYEKLMVEQPFSDAEAQAYVRLHRKLVRPAPEVGEAIETTGTVTSIDAPRRGGPEGEDDGVR